MIRNAGLNIKGVNIGTVNAVKHYLAAIEGCYIRLCFLESIANGDAPFPKFTDDFNKFENLVNRADKSRHSSKKTNYLDAQLVGFIKNSDIGRELTIDSVRFSSPGFWEFLGRLNPLDVIRVYINDRHERLKDNNWRDDLSRREKILEIERISLENKMIKTEIIERTLSMARNAGISEDEISALFDELLHGSLMELDQFQDMGLITTAKIKLRDHSHVSADIT